VDAALAGAGSNGATSEKDRVTTVISLGKPGVEANR
jgi:hypothetical protein